MDYPSEPSHSSQQRDTSAKYEEFIVGKRFDSFAQFEEQFTQFKRETGSVFRIKSSSSATQDNKRRQTPIPEIFKYSSVTYCCVHYGLPKNSGSGVRPKQRYLPCGCEVLIAVSYKNGALIAQPSKQLAHNHNLDVETAGMYASNRRLVAREIEAVKQVMMFDPKPQQLLRFVSSRFNKRCTSKDINNLKAKLRASDNSMDALIQLFEEVGHDGQMSIILNEDHTLTMISFASKTMISLYHQFPEMLFIDGTYKVNKYRYPLYQVMIQDNMGRGRAVFYCFLSSETAPTLAKMMSEFKSMMDGIDATKTVMLDRDVNEIAAVREHLPDATILLCSFHVLKNFKKRVSELVLPVEAKTKIFRLMRDILYSQTADEFETRMQVVQDENESIAQYLRESWVSDQAMWVAYHRKRVLNFGNDTNNIIESENGKLKHLLSSTSSLPHCVRSLLFRKDVLDAQRCHDVFLQTATDVVFKDVDPSLHPLLSSLTDFAANKVRKHILVHCHVEVIGMVGVDCYAVKDQGKTYEVRDLQSCTCTFSNQTMLPCRHLITLAKHLGEDLSSLAANSRWNKGKSKVSVSSSQSMAAVDIQPTQRPMTEVQRFHSAEELTTRLQQIITASGAARHQKQSTFLKAIISAWENGDDLNAEAVFSPTIISFPAAIEAAISSLATVKAAISSSAVVESMSSSPTVVEAALSSLAAVEASMSSLTALQAAISSPAPEAAVEVANSSTVIISSPAPEAAVEIANSSAVIISSPAPEDAISPPHSPTFGPASVQLTSSPLPGVSSTCLPSRTFLSPVRHVNAAVGSPVDLGILRTMQLPVIKPHGRPRVVRRLSRFKKGQQGASDASQPTSRRKRSRKEEENSVICGTCSLQDPPRDVNRDPEVAWVECEVCAKWYHVHCIQYMGGDDFVCCQ